MSGSFKYWYLGVPVVHVANAGNFSYWLRGVPVVQFGAVQIQAQSDVVLETQGVLVQESVVSHEFVFRVGKDSEIGWEALGVVLRGGQAFLESGASLVETKVIPWSSLVGGWASFASSYEAARLLVPDTRVVHEVLGTLLRGVTLNAEFLGSLRSLSLLVYEVMSGARVYSSLNYEALVLRLLGLLSRYESLLSVRRGSQGVLESLVLVDVLGDGGHEALRTILEEGEVFWGTRWEPPWVSSARGERERVLRPDRIWRIRAVFRRDKET